MTDSQDSVFNNQAVITFARQNCHVGLSQKGNKSACAEASFVQTLRCTPLRTLRCSLLGVPSPLDYALETLKLHSNQKGDA